MYGTSRKAVLGASPANVDMVPPETLVLEGRSLCKPCFRAIRDSVGGDQVSGHISDASVDDLSSVGSSDSDVAAFEELVTLET